MNNSQASFRLGLLAAAVALAGAAQAATVNLPAELPPFGKDKPLAVPNISQQTLPNGLQVWVVPRNGIPRVDFVLAVRGAGFSADAADAPGRAKLLAGLLSEGTTQRSSKQIAEAAQAMGGSVGAGASNDGISVYGNALASHAGAMARLLAEVARQPAFPQGEVQLAKTNALQGLKASSTQPSFRAAKALDGAIYGNHAYGRTQETEAAITTVTAEGLRAEHARRFRPDRALLVITGRIDSAAALKLAREAFGDWQASGDAVPEVAPPAATAPVQRLLLERPGSVQATLRLGRPGMAASGDEQVALRLTSTVIGTGFSSRLNQNLREEKGYTYGARAVGVALLLAQVLVQPAGEARADDGAGQAQRHLLVAAGGHAGAAQAQRGLHAARPFQQQALHRRGRGGGRHFGHRVAAGLPVAEGLAGQLQRRSRVDAAGDDQQRPVWAEAPRMLGAQAFGCDGGDGRLGLLRAAVGVVAVDGAVQRLGGAEGWLRAAGLEALQRIGLGELHLALGEGRLAGNFGQQPGHGAGMRGQGIAIDADAVVAGTGADGAAHGLGGLGDLLGAALGRAFRQQARQQLGAARCVRGVGTEAGAAHGQHEVHARDAIARHDPHLQAVGQRLLADVGHGQRLVLAEGRQLGGQVDGGGLRGAGEGDSGGQEAEAEGSLGVVHGEGSGIKVGKPAWRQRRPGPGRPAWRRACGR